MSIRMVKFLFWFVGLLPKRLVYFCFMHVMAYSTTGKYSNTVVPDITGMDAMKRYADDNGLDV